MKVGRAEAIRLGIAQILAWGGTYYLPAILAQPIAADLGIAVTEVFWAFSGALILSAVLGPTIGRWIDRQGGRAALTVSAGIIAAGLVALAIAEGRVGLWIAWGLLGIGLAAGLYEAAFAVLAARFGDSARAPITMLTLIAGFASLIAWPLTGTAETLFGWRLTCLIWAGLMLVVALPLYLTLPAGRPQPEAPSKEAAPSQDSHAMTLLAAAFTLGWFVSSAMAAHLPLLLQAAGAAPAAAIAAAALVGPAQVVGRLAEAALAKRLHPLITARAAYLTHPVGAALVAAGGPPAALPMLHGLGNGVATIARGTVPLALFGPRDYGLRQGRLAAPARIAAALAPALFALAIARWGAGALWLSAGLSLTAAALLCLVRTKP